MNQYMAYFDYTTVHTKGKFVGRMGQLAFETTDSMQNVLKNINEVQQLCADFVYSEKPKWNILMLTVTSVVELNTENNDNK